MLIRVDHAMKKLVFILLMVIIGSSCRKTAPSGGVVAGGAEVDGQVMHHSWSIPQCKVYIKPNCSSFPGHSPSLYDSFKIADNSGIVQFDKLGNGTYFFYAIGYDINVADTVWGYNTIYINNRPGEVKNYELTVPVSE